MVFPLVFPFNALLALLALASAGEMSRAAMCGLVRQGAMAFYVVDSRCEDFNGTLLHEAAGAGHVAVVKELLHLRAAVDAGDSFEMTPLAWAALKGHALAAEELLRADASVEARDEFHSSPLTDAAKEGHVKVAELLLDSGAAVDGKGFMGRTALMEAAMEGHPAMAALLLRRGASPEATDFQKLTPLVRAAQQGDLEMVKVLVQNGARIAPVFGASPEIRDFLQQQAMRRALLKLPCLALAAVLGAIIAWAMRSTAAEKGEAEAEDFHYGATLRVVAEGQTWCFRIFNFAGRCLEVGTVAVLIFGFGMGLVWWVYWLALCLVGFVVLRLVSFGRSPVQVAQLQQLLQLPQLLTQQPLVALLRTLALLLLGFAFWRRCHSELCQGHQGLRPESEGRGFLVLPLCVVACGYCIYLLIKVLEPWQACTKMEIQRSKVDVLLRASPTGIHLSIVGKLLLMSLGLALDVNTVVALTEHLGLAFVLVLATSRCVARQFFLGNLLRLPEAARESAGHGIERRDFLELVDEDSARAFISICVTSFSFWYCVEDVYQATTQGMSILLSLFTLAGFLFRRIDLNVDPQNLHASFSL